MDLHIEAGWGERSGESGKIPAEKMAGADPPPLVQVPASVPSLSLSPPLPSSLAPLKATVVQLGRCG